MLCIKKDDDWGRWIVEFLPLNAGTITHPIAIGDVFGKVRSLANPLYKSMLDAWSGFNQVENIEETKRLLTIQTSLGLRQWECCPFGVTNGPQFYQSMMQDLYGDMTADQMSETEATLGWFMDDGALGTGDALDPSVWDRDANDEGLFEQHLVGLQRVVSRARLVGLRFKLSKCHFL